MGSNPIGENGLKIVSNGSRIFLMVITSVSSSNIKIPIGMRYCLECGNRCRVGRADTWRRAGKTCPACGSRRLDTNPQLGLRNTPKDLSQE